jgi:hypothetical protein
MLGRLRGSRAAAADDAQAQRPEVLAAALDRPPAAAAWARRASRWAPSSSTTWAWSGPISRSASRYEAQTIISNGTKELAEELGCPVIALNQMNRQNESRDDKRPQLSDLRDSGSWEQDADYVIGWYREAYYAQKQTEPKKELEIAEWLRAKNSREVEAIILKARPGPAQP